MSATIKIEVVFAVPGNQRLELLGMRKGATVADAITASNFDRAFPEYDLAQCAVGVWGQLVERDRPLADGDRVELYRALQLDPREARRRLAAAGKTMRQSTRD